MVVIDRKLRKWSELIERCGREVGRERGDGVVRRAGARRAGKCARYCAGGHGRKH